MIQPSALVAPLAPYALPRFDIAPGKPLISLASNENPDPPSPAAIEAAGKAVGRGHLYPDVEWGGLPGGLAAQYQATAGTILCGAGSMELIDALMRAYCAPGTEVLSSAYAYAYFRTATDLVGGTYRTVPETSFTVSIDALLEGVTPATRIVCVANPGNPTGTRLALSELQRLRDGLAQDVLLVVDEAYGEFVDHLGEAAFGLVARGDTVVLRTFSKAYALAGLRVGWGLFPPHVAVEMRKILRPNSVSAPGLAAAIAALEDQAHMQRICALNAERRDQFAAAIRDLGLSAPTSHTNFVLIDFGSREAAGSADNALRAEGIVMRPMAGYGLAHCLRATIAGQAAMEQTVEVLRNWKGGEKI